MKKKAVRELRVVFDTNPLYTVIAHDLVSQEVEKLIRNNSQHIDVHISWYIPSIVVQERKFQMVQKAKELLPSLRKIETLLGHNLAITAEILQTRVDQAIQTSLDSLKLNQLDLNVNAVDWKTIIGQAVQRLPPFESGTKEKGFRDAIAAECYLQLIESSPKTATKCLIVFVTEDKLLTEAVEARIQGNSNCRVLAGLEELNNLINTLCSEVDEAFVEAFRKKAGVMFFTDQTNKDALYYKEKIRDRLKSEFSAELEKMPDGVSDREVVGWQIAAPKFLKKEGQRMFWATRITQNVNLFRTNQTLADMAALAEPGLRATTDEITRFNLDGWKDVKVGAGTGKIVFFVNWSTAVRQHGKLTAPHIDEIAYQDSVWSSE